MEDRGGGTVTVSTEASADYVAIRFEDDGPGMDAETAHKAFDPFYSTREDGTGLGLTIVHRIVDEHDGHVEVTSTPGEGATFTVYLQIRQGPTGYADRADDDDMGE
jgi:signal transduction histidine kinase